MHVTHARNIFVATVRKTKARCAAGFEATVAWNAGDGKTSALGGTQMEETSRELARKREPGRPGPRPQISSKA